MPITKPINSRANLRQRSQADATFGPRNRQASVKTKSTNYQILAEDSLIKVSGNHSETLPDATLVPGEEYTLVKTDSNVTTVTMLTLLGQTMSGIASGAYTLTEQFQFVTFRSDGANWIINLADNTNGVTGTLPVTHGGTGGVTLSNLLFGNGAGAITAALNLFWDSINFRLRIGSSGPLLEKKSDNSLYLKKTDTTQSYPIVVSADPGTNGLMVVRGRFTAATGGVLSGEGFTAVRNSVGNYTVTFSVAFADVPAVTAVRESGGLTVMSSAPLTGSVTLFSHTIDGTQTLFDPTSVNFIAVGQRGA